MTLPAAAREEFRQLVGPLLTRAVLDVSLIRDPGERELASRSLLPEELLDGPGELLSEALDDVAEAHGGGLGGAGMGGAARTPSAAGARVRLEELDNPPPGLGHLAVEQAWQLEADEPVAAIFLLCEREGSEGRQLFSFTIEAPISGGAVKDGFVTGTTEGMRLVKKLTHSLPGEADLRPLDPSVASGRVAEAAVQGARTALAPTNDGLAALTIFLRASRIDNADAIVQALELGESLEERVAELEDEAKTAAVAALAGEARAWLEAQGHDSERAEATEFTAGLMGDFRAFYLDTDIAGWTARELDEFLLDWVPRKVLLADSEIEAFPASVTDALAFLGATGRLTERQAASLSARVRRQAAGFAQAMANPANTGPAKALVDAMVAEGVAVGDQEAMQAWLEDFNSRPLEERERVLGPALPRPDEGHPPPRPKPRSTSKTSKAQKQARRRNRGR